MQLNPPPGFIHSRIELFEKLKTEYDAKIAAKDPTPIKVSLSDGKVMDGKAWRTSPYDIACRSVACHACYLFYCLFNFLIAYCMWYSLLQQQNFSGRPCDCKGKWRIVGLGTSTGG